MKIKFWFWKIIVICLFIISYLVLINHFKSLSIYFIYINLSVCFISFGIILSLKPKLDILFTLIFVMFLSVYTWSQSLYIRSFGQLAYLNTVFSLKNEGVKSISSILEFLSFSDITFTFMPILIVIFILFSKKSKISIMLNHKIKLLFVTTMFIFSVISFLFFINSLDKSRYLEEDFFYYKTDHYLFYTKPSSILFVDKFGLNAWLMKDIFDVYIYPYIHNNDLKVKEITKYLDNNYQNKSSHLNSIFENKSLLVIEAESLNNYAIDPVLTPTLYRLFINGYKFPNYNSPLLLGSTSDAELMVNTGLLPPDNGYVTFLKYFNNSFPTTLAKEFNQEGYYSIASHNNYGEFYNRDVMYPNFGYEFFDCIDMGFSTQFINDSEYIEVLTWILIERPEFLSYWITFNGHQPYNDVESLSDKIKLNLNIVKDTYPDIPIGEQVYLAKNMDLDKGLEYLLEVFTYSNRLDDLVIVIYGDHAPKGIFQDGIIGAKDCEILGYTEEQCLNTPLIIWHNDDFTGNSLTISNPTDISPTLYDLFGIEYEYNNVFGNSVFSSEYKGFYFDSDSNIKTNEFLFNSLKNTFETFDNTENRNWSTELNSIKYRMKIYRSIIEVDYFAQETQ